MSVTIQATTIPNWQRDSDVVLRLYASASFVSSDGALIVAGNQSEDLSTNNNFFQSVACSLSAGSLSIPQIVLPSTTDSPDNPAACWCAFFFTAEGDLIGPFGQFASFRLTPTPSTISWAAIAATGGTGAIGSEAPAYFFAGSWVIGKPYGQFNVVTNGNSLWIAMRPNLGVTPSVGDDWQLLIENTQGPPGIQGPSGTLTPLQLANNRDAGLPLQKNIFDPARLVPDVLITFATGLTSAHAGESYFSSGFMQVTPGQQYVANQTTLFGDPTLGWGWYDANYAFLSGVVGVAAGTPVTAPANAIYARVGLGTSATGQTSTLAASLMIVAGTTIPSVYLPFQPITSTQVASVAVTSAVAAAANLPAVRNLFDLTAATAGSLVNYTDGTLASYTGSYGCTGFMPVAGLNQIVASLSTSFAGLPLGFAFYDLNKAYISGIAGVAAATAVTVPGGAVYCRVGFGDGTSTGFASFAARMMVVPGNAVPSQYIAFGSVDSATVSAEMNALLSANSEYTLALLNIRNVFDFSAITPSCLLNYSTGAVVTGYTGYAITNYMAINGIAQISANVNTFYSSYPYGWCFYDINKTFIGGVLGVAAGTGVTVPAGAFYARVGFGGGTSPTASSLLPTMMVVSGTVFPAQYVPFGPSAPRTRWYGKNYGCVGDSITANGSGQSYGYQNAICAALGMNLVIDNGCSGRNMVDFTTYAGYTSVTNSTTIQEVDLETVFLGTNDFGNGVPLGDPLTSTDASTFYGGMDLLINTVLGWKPTLKLVFFTPLQRSLTSATGFLGQNTANAQGHVLEDYANAALVKTKQYGIYCVDLFHECGYNHLNIGSPTTPIYAYDGQLHPNQAGYQNTINPFVISRLQTI